MKGLSPLQPSSQKFSISFVVPVGIEPTTY